MKKILPFESILHNSQSQVSFRKFLERDGTDVLFRFWLDVEKLKHVNLRFKYELANNIYENYLKNYDSPVRDEIDKDMFKSIQLFLIGNNVSTFVLCLLILINNV